MLNLAYALEDCKGVVNSQDVPCNVISSWQFTNACNTYTVTMYNSNSTYLDVHTMGEFGETGRCNVTFNHSAIGSYLLNWSSGDSAKIIVEEDNNMLIALVIGVCLIVALFVFLTFATKDDKPFLANFFFLGIFIFTTVLANLMWKITNVNTSPYEPIMFIIYRIFLYITMLMMFVVLILLTVEAIQVRKIQGNPVDHYRDNLGKNE